MSTRTNSIPQTAQSVKQEAPARQAHEVQVVEAIPESKYKKFWVVSAYMKKAEGGTQVPNAKDPGSTPNASLASSSSASAYSISQVAQSVNAQRIFDGSTMKRRRFCGSWKSKKSGKAKTFQIEVVQ